LTTIFNVTAQSLSPAVHSAIALRGAHEAVLPPPPLLNNTFDVLSDIPTDIPINVPTDVSTEIPAVLPRGIPSITPTTGRATVGHPVAQARWLSTLSLMAEEPDSDLATLSTIRSFITEGVSLPLLTDPAATAFSNTPTVDENAEAVRTRLREYVQFGAVVELDPATADLADLLVQPLHVIIKAEKKPRVVIDLSRNLNAHLEYEYFQYSCVDDAVEASYPGCWYGKLDLSNCFLSFPLHPSVRRYFCFRFDGRLYQFTHMPFGLSIAPRVCTQLLSVVAFALTRAGIRHVRYLDDFFLIGASSEEVSQQLITAQAVITGFGLVVNPDKTEGPSQSLSFLGIQLDSIAQTVSCTAARVAELTALLQSLRHQHIIQRRHAESLIGKLSFAAQVLPGARPFMRRMLDALRACTSRRRSAPIHIDAGFRSDVRFWLQHFSTWNGRQQWRSARASPFVFASDASLGGFGFYLESTPTPPGTVDSSNPGNVSTEIPVDIATDISANVPTLAAWPQHLRVGATFSGSYSPEHAHLHHSHTQIAWCELLAVVACATTYAPLLTGQSLLFFVDNSTDVHIINRQGTRSKALAGLLRQLYATALRYNLFIQARHRPGVDNTLADFLSRPELHEHRHVAKWQSTHPDCVAALSSVSLVSSLQFAGSSTCMLDTHSGSTRTSPTPHDSASSRPSAPPCA
jgi:hypothetical protein